MDVDDVVRRVRAVAVIDESHDRAEVLQGVADLAAVRRWCDGREVALAGFMATHSPLPEKHLADAGRSSRKKARRALRRKEITKETPKLGKALEEGKVSGEHVDAAGAALRDVGDAKRPELAGRIDALTGAAEAMSPEEFGRKVRDEQRRLEDDEGEDRLARQQRAIRFNHRVDPASGMVEFWGKADPLGGMTLLNRLNERVDRLFADKTPEDCPSDPVEKNAYLRALALLDLCEGHGQRGGRPEVIVVVDTRDAGSAGGPHVDWGIPVELPDPGAHRHARRGRRAHGRRAQRGDHPRPRTPQPGPHHPPRQPRPTASVASHLPEVRDPGLPGAVRPLQGPPRPLVAPRRPHRPGEPAPVCVRHHTAIHDEGWTIELGPDRVLTLTLPNGEVMTTGLPRGAPHERRDGVFLK